MGSDLTFRSGDYFDVPKEKIIDGAIGLHVGPVIKDMFKLCIDLSPHLVHSKRRLGAEDYKFAARIMLVTMDAALIL